MSAALVLTPRQAAAILGVSHQTIRRWAADGACPNVFASLPGARIGVPLWWVEALTSPEPVVVAGQGSSGPAAAVPHGNNGGGSHLRTVRGSHPRTA